MAPAGYAQQRHAQCEQQSATLYAGPMLRGITA